MTHSQSKLNSFKKPDVRKFKNDHLTIEIGKKSGINNSYLEKQQVEVEGLHMKPGDICTGRRKVDWRRSDTVNNWELNSKSQPRHMANC